MDNNKVLALIIALGAGYYLVTRLRPGLMTIPPQAQAAVTAARVNLARMLTGGDISRIRVLSVAEKSWPDTSLGCGTATGVYEQIITPGWRILLRAEGVYYIAPQREYYHTNADGSRLVYCPVFGFGRGQAD